MDVIRGMVSSFRDDFDTSELEIRLGTKTAQGFVPGVSRETFEELERDFEDCGLKADEKYVEIVDYHYTTKDGKVRTRVEYDSKDMVLLTHHVKKHSRDFVTLVCRNEDVGCRIALSTEEPVKQAPSVCIPSHVRVKQRRCFEDVRDGKTVWRYELSKTWSGSTRGAVEHNQHNVPPVFEVEVELVDEDNVYTSTRTDSDITDSILMKAQLLLGNDHLE